MTRSARAGVAGGAEVGIFATGVANLEAVAAALRRLGVAPRRLDAPIEIAEADYLVLPGVGSFAGGLAAIERGGRGDAIRDRIEAGRPTLAICLGLQLLCETSEEAPDARGLGCIPAHVRRFSGETRVPQLGWNRIEAAADTLYLRSAVMYFANSYRIERPPAGWAAAISRYGGRFVAGLERRGVLACQFHPELSGRAGHALIARWLESAPRAAIRTDATARARPAVGVRC